MENFNILEKKENPLFNRKEIIANVEAEITPSRIDVIKLISEKLSVSTENIKIKNILGKFGSKIFTINANVYASKQDKDKTEPKSKRDIKEIEPPIEEPEAKPQEQIDIKSQNNTENNVDSQKEQTPTNESNENKTNEDKSK